MSCASVGGDPCPREGNEVTTVSWGGGFRSVDDALRPGSIRSTKVMQMLGSLENLRFRCLSHSRTLGSEPLGMGSKDLYFNKPSLSLMLAIAQWLATAKPSDG